MPRSARRITITPGLTIVIGFECHGSSSAAACAVTISMFTFLCIVQHVWFANWPFPDCNEQSRSALTRGNCSVSSNALIQHPSPVLCITSNSCSRDYLLVRCTEICPVDKFQYKYTGQISGSLFHKDHCSLHLPALEIHAHPLTSTALLSCQRPLPRPLSQYLVSRSVQQQTSAPDAFSP